MTIAGTAFASCQPCRNCDSEGEQVWLEARSKLCYYCRRFMSEQTDLTVYEGKLEEAALSIADYVSDDAKAHVLTTKEDYAEAADIINQLKSVDKALETMEKVATSGALKTVAWIRDRFRPHRQQVKE